MHTEKDVIFRIGSHLVIGIYTNCAHQLLDSNMILPITDIVVTFYVYAITSEFASAYEFRVLILVKDELERIAGDENLKHLIQK